MSVPEWAFVLPQDRSLIVLVDNSRDASEIGEEIEAAIRGMTMQAPVFVTEINFAESFCSAASAVV